MINENKIIGKKIKGISNDEKSPFFKILLEDDTLIHVGARAEQPHLWLEVEHVEEKGKVECLGARFFS